MILLVIFFLILIFVLILLFFGLLSGNMTSQFGSLTIVVPQGVEVVKEKRKLTGEGRLTFRRPAGAEEVSPIKGLLQARG